MSLYEVLATAPINTVNFNVQSITLASGYRYRIKSIVLKFVAAGSAARYLSVTFENANGDIFLRISSITNIEGVTLTTLNWTLGEGMEDKAIGGTTVIVADTSRLPDSLVVEGGTVIKTECTGSLAADRWGKMVVFGQQLPLVG